MVISLRKDFRPITEARLLSVAAVENVFSGTVAARIINSYKKIFVGFGQVGAQSGWRVAKPVSIKESANMAGIDRKFSVAQQKCEN